MKKEFLKLWSKLTASRNHKQGLVREILGISLKTMVVAIFALTFLIQNVKITTGSMKNTILVGDHVLMNKFIFAHDTDWAWPLIPQREIRRGDIVVFKFPKDPQTNFVKRVVGLPGETIEIRGITVFINGKELIEQKILVNSEYDRLHRFEPLQIISDTGGHGSAKKNQAKYQVYFGERKIEPANPAEGYLGTNLISNQEAAYSVASPYRIPPNHYFCLGDNRDNSQDSRSWGVVPRQNIIGCPTLVLLSTPFSEEDSSSGFFSFFAQTQWARTGTRIR